MNILFNLHSYIPEQMSGAETMAHRMAKFLVSKGHSVVVRCPWPDKEVDGVKVRTARNEDSFEDYDLVFTHLNATPDTFNRARAAGKKIIHIAHNSFNYQTVRVRVANNFLVYNSEWIKDALGYKQEGIVLNPPVDYRDYAKVKPAKSQGKYVTLINHNENKGGRILIEIAKRLPDVQFLAVEGGYYEQIKDESLRNIKYTHQQADIRKALSETKILIVPSEYESWGQVAIEAAACGIPVIANDTPGLRSSLAEAGIFCERNDIDAWVKAIRNLQEPKTYEKWSKAAKDRAIALDPLPQLEAFEQWLLKIHKLPYQ
jgi:glycosyltransferase involved in cell wall biosynthesis